MHLQLLPGSLRTPKWQGSATPLINLAHSPSADTVQNCLAHMQLALSRARHLHCHMPLLPRHGGHATNRLHLSVTLRSTFPEGKRRSFVAMPTLVASQSERFVPAKSLAQAHGTEVSVETEDTSLGKLGKN